MNRIIAALLLTVLSAASASANGDEAPAIFAKMKPKVGAWAEYSFETKKGDKLKTKGRYKMSVVGKEGDSLWIEQKMTREIPKPKRDEDGMIMKFLASKDGFTKAYMKSSRGVMDMSAMMARGAALRKKQQELVDKTKMVEAGTETIEVPAGKFKTTHYTFGEDKGKDSGDAWIKPGVGPYGMIKQESRHGKGSSTLVLLASGDDAKSEVDEKTAMASPMDAMRGRRPRHDASESEGDGEAAKSSDADAPKRPKGSGLGGLFKKAMKQQVGLDD